MVRSTRRWQTTFGRWVQTYTVPRLAQDLAARGNPATPKAIYHWLAGRAAPRGAMAMTIVELSGGKLSFTDVYAHQGQVGERPR